MSFLNRKRYVIAVSGGPDSMALLHMYHKYVKAVCTVKYNKRPDCDFDVECVKKLCSKYNLQLELLDVTDEIYNSIDENNFQNKARIIRYNFFKEIAKKYNTNKILVAHHLDDFLETAYMQQKQSTNLNFYGIKEITTLDDGFEIHRPLIRKYRKSTLERYCQDFNIEYAIDSSNDLPIYERNRVRKIISTWDTQKIHEFLKTIDKLNKNKQKEYKENLHKFNEWKKTDFSISFLKALSKEQQVSLIYLFLEENKLYRQSFAKVKGIIEFIFGVNGKKYRLLENLYLIKLNNKVLISKE